jgi:glyoxylase-like metal-dependent hydrolase (beta-lactamase superfamily II)
MAQKIITLDCQYVFPQYAAAYLLTEGSLGAFIENNTAHSVPILLAALRNEGISPESVQYVIITHVHLDHAGGSSALMKACPNAVLLAHPRAAVHIIDPSKLIRSAKEVYGPEIFSKLYGDIEPIPSQRVRIVEDRESIQFESRVLHFIHTRGHANHHFCIFDPVSEGIFTGDSFGLAYPALQRNGLFVIPSTSPTDFDPIEAKNTLQKILDLKPKRAFLTHFGEIQELREAADQLTEHLNFSEELMNKAIKSSYTDNELTLYCENEMHHYFQNILTHQDMTSDKAVWDLLKTDIHLNAAGIAHSARKTRRGSEKLS